MLSYYCFLNFHLRDLFLSNQCIYNPHNGEEEFSHREPKEILKEIESDEKNLRRYWTK